MLWVIFFVKKSWIDYDRKLNESLDTSVQEEALIQDSAHGGVLVDILPILVPILLIGAGAFVHFNTQNIASKAFEFISIPMVGCGSFCVFHANSSFFWLLNRLHEVPPKILYRTFTVRS